MVRVKTTKHLNDKQRKAIQGVAAGMTNGEAGIKAGYSPKTAYSHVQRMLKNVEAKAYLAELRAKVEDDALMSIKEKRTYLANAVRTPISEIDEDNTLCTGKTYSKDGDAILHSVDPVVAIREDSKLAGHYAAEKLEVSGLANLFEQIESKGGLHNDIGMR